MCVISDISCIDNGARCVTDLLRVLTTHDRQTRSNSEQMWLPRS